MSKTLWAVSIGSYSDYRVQALFETEEQAEKVVREADAIDSGYGYYTETFEFYAKDETPEAFIIYQASIWLFDDGTYGAVKVTSDGPKMEFQHFYKVPPKTRPHIRQIRTPYLKGKGARLDVTGRTDTMVRKVVSDRLAEHKALGPRKVPEINV
jgi:hypothetical protein